MKLTLPGTILLLLCSSLFAGNSIQMGELTSPYPTLINISLEWPFSGDDNRNSTVSVRFRVEGTNQWLDAMDLRRVDAGSNVGFSWESMYAGSIFDLKPATSYEVALTVEDSDGGTTEETISVKTRDVVTIPDNAIIVDLPAGNHDVLDVQSGTEDAPRVYRSLDGTAVCDFISLSGKEWIYLWGLTIKSSGNNNRNAIKMNGAKNCVVRYCTIEGQYGIVAYGDGITNCYIADNTITGTSEWSEASLGAHGDNIGEGIQFTGPGNVVCFNKVTGFRDCISTMEDSEAKNQRSIDIYNNDLNIGADDGIEADFCMANVRVMRNRLTNCYVALSSQPALGGPVYFIRNQAFNAIHAAFKYKRFSQGNVTLHNSIVKIGAGLGGNSEMDYAYFRNNVAFGGPTYGKKWGGYSAGNPYGAEIYAAGDNSSFDYDAVGVVNTPYVAKIDGKVFSEVEQNGIGNLDYNKTFGSIPFPENPVPAWDMHNLTLSEEAAVIDNALLIPNVNDNYKGDGPDRGALEFGTPLPHYGPREKGVNEGDSSTSIITTKKTEGVYPFSYTQRGTALQFMKLQNTTVSLFNLKGQKLLEQRINSNGLLHIGDSFSSGTYLLSVSSPWYASFKIRL